MQVFVGECACLEGGSVREEIKSRLWCRGSKGLQAAVPGCRSPEWLSRPQACLGIVLQVLRPV